MILKKINKEDVGEYLERINYIAYSDDFARFAQSAYGSQRSFVGIFDGSDLKAFFPIFDRKNGGQHIVEVPLFIYTEIFFIDSKFIVDGFELGRELVKLSGCQVVRLNVYKSYFPENFKTNGFQEIFTTMVILLEGVGSFEDYLMNSISRNARSKIYKGRSSGFEFVKLTEKDLQEFYDLYRAHVKFLNSTPHPIDYFRKIIDAHEASQNLFMFGVRHNDGLVAVNLFVLNKDYLEVKFLADDVQERRLFPNNFLYAEMIRWAIAHKVKLIDLGGIPNTMRSNIEFKKSFGAKEYPIYTQYLFKNRLQEIIFKLNRRIFYIKKYPRLIMKRFFLI